MSVRGPTGLEVDDHLATLVADRSTEHEIDLARQQDRPVEWPLHARLGHRSRPLVEWGEALAELRDAFDGKSPQIGFVGGRKSGDPVTERAVLVREAGHRVVDDVGRHRLAPPVDDELDRAVGDLPTRQRGRPRERIGMEVLHLTSECAREGVLADVERLLAQTLGELLECRHDVVLELGDQFGVEHDRLGGAAQRFECAPLQWCQCVERPRVRHRWRLYGAFRTGEHPFVASVTLFRVGR